MLLNMVRGHAAEFGVVAATGVSQIATLFERVAATPDIPALARALFVRCAGQIAALAEQLAALERQLMAWHRHSECSQRLAAIPGVGPITATALAMKVPDPGIFQSARHFAAWVGLTPKDHSTAGRQRLGGITHAGDATLRRLLVSGAMAVIRRAKAGRATPWLHRLLARKSAMQAAVALANKTARIAWALMRRGEVYRQPTRRHPQAAQPQAA